METLSERCGIGSDVFCLAGEYHQGCAVNLVDRQDSWVFAHVVAGHELVAAFSRQRDTWSEPGQLGLTRKRCKQLYRYPMARYQQEVLARRVLEGVMRVVF